MLERFEIAGKAVRQRRVDGQESSFWARPVDTANRLFKGRSGLVLLCIDTTRVQPEIRYENLEGGANLFPHIYGALAPEAVVAVHDFPPRGDGCFKLPPALNV